MHVKQSPFGLLGKLWEEKMLESSRAQDKLASDKG